MCSTTRRTSLSTGNERSIGPLLALLWHAAFSMHRAETFVAATSRGSWQKHGDREAPHISPRLDNTLPPQLLWVRHLDDEQEKIAAAEVTRRAKAVPAAAKAKATQSKSRCSGSILTPLKESIKMTRGHGENADTALLYFAFGANMCPSVLTRKRGVTPFASLPAEAIQFSAGTQQNQDVPRGVSGVTSRGGLDKRPKEGGICVCFCHRAGYATLARNPGPPQSWETSPGAHGVLHVISPSSLTKIADAESGYQKRLVDVETIAGERDIAVCFVSNPWQTLPTSVPPTSRYLSLLQNGAAYHGVDECYQSWLARLPSVRPDDEAMSRERTNTPSKIVTDTILTVVVAAALGAAGAAIRPF